MLCHFSVIAVALGITAELWSLDLEDNLQIAPTCEEKM